MTEPTLYTRFCQLNTVLFSEAEQLRPALNCLRNAPAASTALDTLARQAGMSRYQLIRAFRAATGMTPHAWQLNLRVNLAREHIQAGDGIADVAHRLGVCRSGALPAGLQGVCGRDTGSLSDPGKL